MSPDAFPWISMILSGRLRLRLRVLGATAEPDDLLMAAVGDLVVAAICVVNAFGDIGHGGQPISFDAVRNLRDVFKFEQGRSHTTIGIVVTNASFDKTGCRIVARGGRDGIARSLTPAHTPASTAMPSSPRPRAR